MASCSLNRTGSFMESWFFKLLTSIPPQFVVMRCKWLEKIWDMFLKTIEFSVWIDSCYASAEGSKFFKKKHEKFHMLEMHKIWNVCPAFKLVSVITMIWTATFSWSSVILRYSNPLLKISFPTSVLSQHIDHINSHLLLLCPLEFDYSTFFHDGTNQCLEWQIHRSYAFMSWMPGWERKRIRAYGGTPGCGWNSCWC